MKTIISAVMLMLMTSLSYANDIYVTQSGANLDLDITQDGANNTVGNSTTASASTGVKDAGGLTCVTGVTAAAHTHTAVIPHAVARYIIKT